MKDHPTNFKITSLASAEVDLVVRLHLRAFPEFFLSFLGPRFLREFYFAFLADPVGMAFVACGRDGQVLGAVVGPVNPQGFFGRLLKRRWWAFCMASMSAVLRRPSCLSRLLRAVFYRGEPDVGPVRALLSSIAVSPDAQGQGVGRALVLRWVAEARHRGAKGCYLTTDAEDNNSVNAFYRSLGWKMTHAFSTPEGRKMNFYTFDFECQGGPIKPP